MEDLEKQYYESEAFWKDGMVADDLNMKRIQKTIEMIPNDAKSLLDVGGGNGVFVNNLIKTRKDIAVSATDRSEAALQFVKTQKYQSDITNLKANEHEYDCVSCLQVLEHIPYSNYKRALQQLANAAKKYLVISVPYKENTKNNYTECPKCLSKFNADLHFRSYDNATIKNLFKGEFKLIEEFNLTEKKSYAIALFEKLKPILKKQTSGFFNSPICPICSYENVDFANQLHAMRDQHIAKRNANNLRNIIKNIAVSLLPEKTIPGYWIIAVYERIY